MSFGRLLYLKTVIKIQKDCECKLNVTSNAKGLPTPQKRHTHEPNQLGLLCYPTSIDQQACARDHVRGRRC